jgi:hypothetical protein
LFAQVFMAQESPGMLDVATYVVLLPH